MFVNQKIIMVLMRSFPDICSNRNVQDEMSDPLPLSPSNKYILYIKYINGKFIDEKRNK